MEISVLNVPEISNNDISLLLKDFNPYYKCFLNSINIFFTENKSAADGYTEITNFMYIYPFFGQNLKKKDNLVKKNSGNKKITIGIGYIRNFLNYSGRNIMDPNSERVMQFEKMLKRLKIRVKKSENDIRKQSFKISGAKEDKYNARKKVAIF